MPSNGSAASISLLMQRMSNCPCKNVNQVSVFMMSEVHIHVVEWQHIKNFKKITKQPLISRWGSWDKYVIDCVQAWHLQRQVSPLIKGLTNTVCKWRNKRFFFLSFMPSTFFPSFHFKLPSSLFLEIWGSFRTPTKVSHARPIHTFTLNDADGKKN